VCASGFTFDLEVEEVGQRQRTVARLVELTVEVFAMPKPPMICGLIRLPVFAMFDTSQGDIRSWNYNTLRV
jgi:hypothetical protein